MISKCAKVTLTKKKFSEFEDGDISDDSLFIVGYQMIDGELTNVKIPIEELLDARSDENAFIVEELSNSGCLPSGIYRNACMMGFKIDVLKTGKFIQFNHVLPSAWTGGPEVGEHRLNFVFKNLPLGSYVKLYFPNFGNPFNDNLPCRVYLYEISEEEMETISTSDCPVCDFEAGQKRCMMFEIDQTLRDDFCDYFVNCIQLSNKIGLKQTRVVNVLNLYDGNGHSPDDNV